MIELAIFGSTFLSVFALGLQSLNVNQGHYMAAGLTSFAISTGHIALYRYMPEASLGHLAAYYAGGITGITSSMWFHRRFKTWWATWQAKRTALPQRGPRRPMPAAAPRPKIAPRLFDTDSRHRGEMRCAEYGCQNETMPHSNFCQLHQPVLAGAAKQHHTDIH